MRLAYETKPAPAHQLPALLLAQVILELDLLEVEVLAPVPDADRVAIPFFSFIIAKPSPEIRMVLTCSLPGKSSFHHGKS